MIKNKIINFIKLSTFLLILLINPGCCDKILSSVIDEFNSERPIKKENISTQNEVSLSHDLIEHLKYANVFLIRGVDYTISPLENQSGTYQLKMKSSTSSLKFGGKAIIGLSSINNLIFVNQWPEGGFNLGGLVLLEENQGAPIDVFINIYIYEPNFNTDDNTFTFLFQPQDDMREVFMKKKETECLLLIYSEEQNF